MSLNVALINLGCSKNLVDSETMLAILKNQRCQVTTNYNMAHIIIVNTCGFILPAKKESINTILEVATYKKTGQCELFIVTGCLSQKYGKELKEEIPEIDVILGTNNFTQVGQVVNNWFKSKSISPIGCSSDQKIRRYLTTPSHMAYVKISEGCNNNCTYCLIPELRGPYKSRLMEDIIEEVRELISIGVQEIILIAQDTTYYGRDIYGKGKLAELIKLLAQEKILWIRIMYCYPGSITQELIDVIAAHDNICNYLDIPLQHVHDKVLNKMGRRETRTSIEELLVQIRQTIPDIALRTTLMVGFPGETEREFQTLLSFVKEQKFDWLGAFTYFAEEDTPASLYTNQVSKKEKKSRYHRLMTCQQKISIEKQKKWVNKTISVLIEGKSSDHPEYFIGRTPYQAPEVDGVVLVKSNDVLKTGELVKVYVTKADIYDLIGVVQTS